MASRTYVEYFAKSISFIFLIAPIVSCGSNQPPSFVTVDTGKRVRLAIEEDSTPSMDASSSNEEINEQEANAILDNLYPEEPRTAANGRTKGDLDSQTADGESLQSTDDSETLNWEVSEDNTDTDSETETETTEETATASTSETTNSSNISTSELEACAAINNIDSKFIHIVGNSKQGSIKLNSVIALKISGNGGELELDLVGRGGSDSINGICLFVTGKQGHASIKITDLQVGKLTYIGRGNKSSSDVTVTSNAELGTVLANLRGNKAKLTVEGEGNYDCGTASIKGNQGKYICQ